MDVQFTVFKRDSPIRCSVDTNSNNFIKIVDYNSAVDVPFKVGIVQTTSDEQRIKFGTEQLRSTVAAKSAVQRAELEITNRERKIARKEEENEELKSHYYNMFKRFESRLTNMENQMNELRIENWNLAQKEDDLSQQVKDLIQRDKDWTQRDKNLSQQVKDLTQQVGELKIVNGKMEQNIVELQNEKDELKRKVDIHEVYLNNISSTVFLRELIKYYKNIVPKQLGKWRKTQANVSIHDTLSFGRPITKTLVTELFGKEPTLRQQQYQTDVNSFISTLFASSESIVITKVK